MKCPSETELNDYSEDRLSTARRWEVEAHLRDCPGCRADLEGLDWAATALGALLADDVPDVSHPSDEDLAALKEGRLRGPERKAILKHLGECPECAQVFGGLPHEQRVLPLVRSWQPLAAAASLLIIVGFIFFVARGQFTPEAALAPPPARHAEMARPPEVPQAVAPGAAAAHTDGLKATTGAGEEPPATKRPPAVTTPKPHGHRGPGKPAGATVTPRPHAPPPAPRERRRVTPPMLAEGSVADAMVPPTPAPSSDAVTARTVAPAPAVVPMFGSRGGAGRPLDVAGGQPEAALPPPAPDRTRHSVGGVGVPKMAPAEPAERATNRLCLSDGLAGNQKPVAAAPPQPSVPVAAGMPPMPGRPAMPAPATRTPGGFSTMSTANATRPAAGGGMPGAPAALALTNRLLLSPEWIAQVRSDPQAKTEIKALLRQMLKEEQSGARREALRRALLALDAPAVSLLRSGAVSRLLKRA